MPDYENFEDTLAARDRWVTDNNNDVWQIGVPTSGPGAAHSGVNCLATTLPGNYTDGTNGRAVGPEFDVPSSAQNPKLQFWQWFDFAGDNGYGGADFGKVQITIDDGVTWNDLSSSLVHSSGGWTAAGYNLATYGGKKARLGFYFEADYPRFNGPTVGLGWYIDELQIVTDGLAAPMASTLPPTNVTQAAADLHGYVNPSGQSTTGYFEYGPDAALMTPVRTPAPPASDIDFGSGSGFVTRTQSLSGLTPGMPYYYRVVATNATGTSKGAILAFHLPPDVNTGAATNIAATTATINGTVNSNGSSGTYHFDYDVDDGQPLKPTAKATALTNLASSSSTSAASANLAPLLPSTTYRFRLVATNGAGGSTNGSEALFTTPAIPPTVVTGQPSYISDTKATFSGTVNPHGTATTYHFDYGKTTGYGLRTNDVVTGPGTAALPVFETPTDLEAKMTYHYRLVATNPASPAGGTLGGDVSFISTPYPTPATTSPAPLDSARRSLSLSTGGFRWRLQGDVQWLDDNAVLAGLLPGEYVFEFEPKPGVPVPPAVLIDVVAGSGVQTATIMQPTAFQGEGALVVSIEPETVATSAAIEQRGQWRFSGEADTQWRNGGLAALTLASGVYILEFKGVPGQAPIPKRGVKVVTGLATSVRALYVPKTQPDTGAVPTPVSLADSTGKAPYEFAGQLQSDVGFGSGTVVKPRVVLTAAHVVFDDATLSYTTGLQWRFERRRGEIEPPPILPRGSYLFASYAGLRKVASDHGEVGAEKQSSQQVDVAAVYFHVDAGRGGFIEVLKTDATYDWLIKPLETASPRPRKSILLGYPGDLGFLLDNHYTEADSGKLFATAPTDAAFTLVPAEDASSSPSRVYKSTAIAGYAGESGGALCVEFEDGNFYPAAVYLGGDGRVVVRAIDDAVVALITEADATAADDMDHTTPGYIKVGSGLSGASFSYGSVTVNLVPAGAQWKLSTEATYHASGAALPLRAGATYVLNFLPVAKYDAPLPFAFPIAGNQVLTLDFEYAKKTAPRFVTSTLPDGVRTVPYRPTNVVVANPPATFLATGLPDGLTLSTAGVIKGTPTTVGTYVVNISAKNGIGTTHAEFPVTIRALGNLKVNPTAGGSFTGYSGAPVGQGDVITLNAVPKQGYFFNNWHGSGIQNLPTANPKLVFTMTEAVDLTAEFTLNPFPAVAGNYRGLLGPNDPPPPAAPIVPSLQGVGVAQINVTTSGGFTGSLAVPGAIYPLKGKFALDGSARQKIKTATGVQEVELTLALAAPHMLTGKLILATPDPAVKRVLVFAARQSMTTLPAARYTLELPPDGNQTSAIYPQGSGVATLTIGKGGAVVANFVLADGTKASAGGYLTAPLNGGRATWSLYTDLYTHQGALAGEISVGDTGQPDLSGDVRWFRSPTVKIVPFDKNGWPATGLVSATLGDKYLAPKTTTAAFRPLPLAGLGAHGVKLTLAGSADFAGNGLVSALGKFAFIGANPAKLQLTLVPGTGLFTGSFSRDGSLHTLTGILEQSTPAGRGAGFLLGPAGSESATLQVLP